MSKDLLALYQQIRETPALTVDLPEESGKGRIVRLDTNIFSLSSWNMEFSKDTFVEAGKGFGATYTTLWPFIRIDYILYPSHFKAVSNHIPKLKYSDHYPVVAEIQF